MTFNARRISFSSALVLGLTAAPATTWAGDWLWPLYERAEVGGQILAGEPRPAVWGTMGEFQKYDDGTGTGSNIIYGHPGHDFRGDAGDTVLMPETATIERVYFDHDNCDATNTTSCRMWFLDASGQNLFYMSHTDTRPDPLSGDILETSMEVRDAFQAATIAGSSAESRTIERGTKLAPLAEFGFQWHHLHLGIFNVAGGYQMQNTIEFLDTNAMGQIADSALLAVDDEAPLIASVGLVVDDEASSGAGDDATTSGTCGPEISGPVDIAADIYDTYYTDGNFADFPQRGVLDPNTGIRRAFYEVKDSAGNLVENGSWYDIVGLPIVCSTLDELGTPVAMDRASRYGCLDAGSEFSTTLTDFFDRMENEDGAPSTGLSVLDYLFDVSKSTSNYSVAGGETYIHLLTNQQGQAGIFDPTGLPNGRYQVTAIAEDFSGRFASRSTFVNYRAPGTTLGSDAPGLRNVYTRDRIDDIGTIPSNPGGEPFWQSPDIFVVPAGSPEPDINSNAVSTVVVEDGSYEIYLRVTNPTCNPVILDGVRIVSADPSAINSVWDPITSGSGYHPDPDDDEVVAPNSSRFFGPYPWSPSAGQTGADGHRCILAGFQAPDDPVGDFFDAPASNNVAQRNMNINGCNFELPNNGSDPVDYELRITTDAVVANEVIELVLPFIQPWFDAWDPLPAVTMSEDGAFMRARLNLADVTLPANGILAGAVIPVSFDFSLPEGTPLRTVNLEPKIGTTALGGMSCLASGEPIIRVR